jgi:hypothetical protein
VNLTIPQRHIAILVSAVLLSATLAASNLEAQSTIAIQADSTTTPGDRIEVLEKELAALRAIVEAGPTLQNTSRSIGIAQSAPPSGGCCHCGSATSCLCPLEPAPCFDCPRVSTLSPHSNVSLFGAVVLDAVFSQPRTIAPGTPFFLLPPSQPGFNEETVSIHARQSSIGAMVNGPQFGGWQSSGTVLVSFFNDALIVDQYGILPLQAFGELRNEKYRITAGLQFDVFNPYTPTILPFSVLSGSGNTGNAFRGQIRLERFFNPSPQVQWVGQVALADPVATTIDPAFSLLEDNGWPNIEGRVAVGMGQPEMVNGLMRRPFEIGVSGVVGQLRTTIPGTTQVVTDVWGAGADLRWKVLSCFGVAGEIYHGEGLGTYNGAVLQNVNRDQLNVIGSTFEAIESTGGWLETFVYWTPCLHSHVGYGIDNPEDTDLGLGQRSRNSTYFANLLWDVNSAFRVAFEFTWRETEYNFPTPAGNEGPGYHTQLRWSF